MVPVPVDNTPWAFDGEQRAGAVRGSHPLAHSGSARALGRHMNMDKSEQIAESHLRSRGFQDIMYEPDGNVPPDFLVDGQIAVEVRRLNQNEDTPEGPRGFEEVAIPLQDAVKRLLNELGPSRDGQSWYVMYDFRRPLAADWRPALRASLVAFRDGAERQPGRRVVVPRFKVNLLRAGRSYPDFFVLGGYADGDSGGFVLSELNRNIRICVLEKTNKVARVRANYPQWWLLLVDHMGFGLDAAEREELRQLLQLDHSWDKILIVSPIDPPTAYEL